MELRPLGTTDIQVSPVALGCWPIAGMTGTETNDADSVATIAACFELGINFLDTAHNYGREGESERLIRQALGNRRDEMVIATKGGLQWTPDRKPLKDASPAMLRRQCDESLRRLGTDRVDLLYLHSPDPKVPLAESAGELRRLLDEGKTRSVGASNVTLTQLQEFAAACPLSAFQPSYNMLQREIESDTLPWCREHNVSVMVYWPLMKGLLAGKLPREHILPPIDSRAKYPMFQGEEWHKNQDFLDHLRLIAADIGKTVAQVVINWTIHRPGVTSALCGAKRPDQLRDTAGAMGWRLSAEHLARIEQAIADRGTVISKNPV
jgi:aryl-alcohol dehydrogenase-like predicted oxidoreductase